MTDEIAGPKAGGAFIAPRDHLNHLVIFTKVHKVDVRYDQKRKQDGEVLTVDFHCFHCSGEADPEEKALGHPWVGSKVQRDGRLTLGYITQLPPTNGNSDGAFVLSDPRTEDFGPVQQWWEAVKARRAQRELAGPSGPPPQQPAAPWGAAPANPPAAPAASGWGTPSAPAPAASNDGASAASAQAPSSPGAGWGQAPPPPQNTAPPVAAGPVNPPTPDQVREMPLQSVQALIANGVLTVEQVRTVRQDV